jgi:hypothetical protein
MREDEIEAVARAFYGLGEDARGWEREPDILKESFRRKALSAVLAIDSGIDLASAEIAVMPDAVGAQPQHLDAMQSFDGTSSGFAIGRDRVSHRNRSDEDTIALETPGFLAVTSGPRHILHLANRPFRRLVGQRRLIGQTMRHALPDLVQQGFVDLLDRVYKTREPFIGTYLPITFRPKPNGPRREHVVDLVYKPIEDIGGRVIGILVEGRVIDKAERPKLL